MEWGELGSYLWLRSTDRRRSLWHTLGNRPYRRYLRLIDGMWVKRSGYARDIGIGADGSVWIIGTSSGSGGHGIYRWNGYDWVQVYGSAWQVSVDPYGLPWVLGTGGKIYQGM